MTSLSKRYLTIFDLIDHRQQPDFCMRFSKVKRVIGIFYDANHGVARRTMGNTKNNKYNAHH